MKSRIEAAAVEIHRAVARGEPVGAAVSRINGANVIGIGLAGDARRICPGADGVAINKETAR